MLSGFATACVTGFVGSSFVSLLNASRHSGRPSPLPLGGGTCQLRSRPPVGLGLLFPSSVDYCPGFVQYNSTKTDPLGTRNWSRWGSFCGAGLVYLLVVPSPLSVSLTPRSWKARVSVIKSCGDS